jgi:signal transduction histidine kinase
MFDKFYRVDASSTSKQGLGLGMTIVKNIIEAHGGQIRVESEPGRGTKIVFQLPVPGDADDSSWAGLDRP